MFAFMYVLMSENKVVDRSPFSCLDLIIFCFIYLKRRTLDNFSYLITVL